MSVDPDAQGLGFCGKLMRAVNVWADNLQLPLWLETSGARNVAIYERCHGWVMFHFMFYVCSDVFSGIAIIWDIWGIFLGTFFPKAPWPLLVFHPTGLVTKLWSSTPWNAKKILKFMRTSLAWCAIQSKPVNDWPQPYEKNSATGDVYGPVMCKNHPTEPFQTFIGPIEFNGRWSLTIKLIVR